MPRALRQRRSGGALVVESGSLHRAHVDGAAPRHENRRPARSSRRDRRRFRRQDRRLCRAGGGRSLPQVGPSREARDKSGRGVQGHRPDLRGVNDGQDWGQEGRQDRRRRRPLQVSGGRLPRLAGHERLHVRLCALRHPECTHGRLRRGLQSAQVGRIPRPRLADLGLRCGEHRRHGRGQDRHGPATVQAEEHRQARNADGLGAEARARRLRRNHPGTAEASWLHRGARQEPGTRRCLGLLVQRRRRIERDGTRQRGWDGRRRDRQPGHRRLARVDGPHGGRDAGHRLRQGPADRRRHQLGRLHPGHRWLARHLRDRPRRGQRVQQSDRRTARPGRDDLGRGRRRRDLGGRLRQASGQEGRRV